MAPSTIVPVALADDPPASSAVTINDGNEWTKTPIVTVALPYPTDSDSLIRLSNNGSTWSSATPWAPTVAWDVTDSTGGGTDSDGEKYVYVQSDDGTGGWSAMGSDRVVLDRAAPGVSGTNVLCHYTSGWIAPNPCWGSVYDDSWESIAGSRMEFSLDGGPWTPTSDVYPVPGFDFRALYLGGGWESQGREICMRAIDPAGNVGSPTCSLHNLNILNPAPDPNGSRLYDIRFEFPLAAVTGQPFTIRPVFPENFEAMENTALCEWSLTYGEKVGQYIVINEDFRSVEMTHLYSRGGCGEWTFTLPYTAGLMYDFSFQIVKKWGSPIFFGRGESMFRATVGTTNPAITNSTIGLAYLLPEDTEVRPGEPITYRIYGSQTPGWTLPSPAWFWADNFECDHGIGPDRPTSSRTWTYTPDCQGPWRTGWTWEDPNNREYLRAMFDPPADKAAPKVSAPIALPKVNFQTTTTIPTDISFTAADPTVNKVSTGLARTQLQMSRNGGAWKNVTLASATATRISMNLLTSGSYRFRARGFDAVGNKSAWSTGPVLKPRLLEQSAASLGSNWTSVSSPSFSGGTAQRSGVAGVNATLTFTGRAISWIGTAGAGNGLAQIRIDGVLVQTVDLASLGAGDKRIMFSRVFPAGGTHTLKITGLGTFSRPTISIDAFTVF